MNYFTVDVEEWYCEKVFKGFRPDKSKNHVTGPMSSILKLLDKYKVKGTFFVLGSIVEKYPELIKEIDKRGHEVACHGYSHKPLHKISPKEFEDEIIKCKKLISCE